MRALGSALVLASVGVLLAACSSAGSVSKADVEQEAAAQLAAAVGVAPDSLTCPGDLAAEVGTEMRCELTAGDATYGLTITVTAVDGESAEFDVVVDDAPVGG
jgi:hypothetical protein